MDADPKWEKPELMPASNAGVMGLAKKIAKADTKTVTCTVSMLTKKLKNSRFSNLGNPLRTTQFELLLNP